MNDALYFLTILAPLAVLVALLLGLVNLARSRSSSTSQRLMRWRVGLQFLAIVLIMVTVYFAG